MTRSLLDQIKSHAASGAHARCVPARANTCGGAHVEGNLRKLNVENLLFRKNASESVTVKLIPCVQRNARRDPLDPRTAASPQVSAASPPVHQTARSPARSPFPTVRQST